MAAQISDSCKETIGVMAKGSDALVATLAQESSDVTGKPIVVDSKALDFPFVATRFCPPANGTEPTLLSEHGLVGPLRDPIVD